MDQFIMSDILFLEACNFETYPKGGQLTFAKQMMSVFKNRLALVGITTDDTPVGKWCVKNINGTSYDFFSIGFWNSSTIKPIIPARLKAYYAFRKFRGNIISKGIKSVFTQSPEAVISIQNWGFENICFRFAGTENPFCSSRYFWPKYFSYLYDLFFFPAVSKANLILASADSNAINQMIKRSRGLLGKEQVIKFTTRVDTNIFYHMPKWNMRKELGIPTDDIVFVTTGRLHWAKGYELMIDSLKLILNQNINACLYLVGDGEHRTDLQTKIDNEGLSNKVIITGNKDQKEVVKYINAADVFVMASFTEGWSTSMMEALACGVPIISTDVSSASEIIDDGINGYVINNRNPVEYAHAMEMALKLNDVSAHSLNKTEKFALNYLGADLERLWPPLS